MIPRQLGDAPVLVDEATVQRLRHLLYRLGTKETIRRLGVSVHTLDQARHGGRIKGSTRTRLVEALEREETLA